MCPACFITIGTGLLIAKKFGVDDVLIIGLLTIILSIVVDIFLRKINNGKVFFPYQRIIMSALILLLLVLGFYLFNRTNPSSP